METLETFVDALARAERQLLPRKKQVALIEMRETLREYERQAVAEHAEQRLAVVRAAQQLLDSRPATSLGSLLDFTEDREDVDLGSLADHWLVLVHPTWQAHLKSGSGSRLLRLRDLRTALRRNPLSTDQLETLVNDARYVSSVDKRVVAAIVGVADQ